MKNIVTRSLSGIVYVALIVGAIFAGHDWFMALMAMFAFLAVREFQMLTKGASDHSPFTLLINTVDIAAAVALCLITHDELIFMIFGIYTLAAYLIIRIILSLYDKRSETFASVGNSILSVLYIGLPLALAALLDRCSGGQGIYRYLMLVIFIMIWLNDTGAYCVGCTLGRHKLFERLSPKKSWEGFWGGMIFCIAAGIACTYSIGFDRWMQWVGLGITVSIFSTWGDLFESLIKRTLGVKDSGHLIPGHGGILDRIDSLLLVAPACFIYAFLTGLL